MQRFTEKKSMICFAASLVKGAADIYVVHACENERCYE